MPGIFISYRRSDAAGHAGRLFDRLQVRFGAHFVFRDVDDIADGDAFPEVIRKALDTCHVVLVVIGPTWLTAASSDGRRRLDNPKDWVRIETAAALTRGARVIPLLVGGARMPGADDLPDDLKPLAELNGRTLDDTDWDADVLRLTQALEKLARPWASIRATGARATVAIAGLALAAVAAFLVLSTTVPNLVGLSADDARRAASEARLTVVTEVRKSSPQTRGVVLSQAPLPGRRIGNANLALVIADRVPVDLAQWVEVRDQGQEGTGPAFAMATAMSAALARQNRPIRLSPRYLYEKARALDSALDKTQEGANIDIVGTVARDFGAPPEAAWPYIPGEKRSAARIAWPALDRAASAYRADVAPVASLDAVHEQLQRGRYVVAVVRGAETWMDGDIPATGRVPLVERADPAGAHVVVIVSMGGADTPVRFANSWGTTWGDRGFGTMTEAVAGRMLVTGQMWAVDVHP